MIKDSKSFFEWAFEGLPVDHFIVGHFLSSMVRDGKTINYGKNVNLRNADEAAKFTAKHVKSQRETFYALGMFADNWQAQPGKADFKILRKKEHAKYFRVLAFDVDVGVGKHYEKLSDAIGPTVKTLTLLGLNKTEYTLVCSGYGMHVYFKFSQLIQKNEWELIGAKLKSAFLKLHLYIDPTKCGEAAMILRAPGSYNFKQKDSPKLVEVLHLASVNMDPERLLELLKDYGGDEKVQSDLAPVNLIPDLSDVEQLPPSIITMDDLERERPSYEQVQSTCQQLNALASNSQVSEHLWYNALGAAAHTSDPKAAAIAWSKNHPEYNEQATLNKMQQWVANTTGPATCDRFMSSNPLGCDGCIYKGKITTPLQVKYKPVPLLTIEATKAREYTLPFPYSFNDKGGIIKTGESYQVVTVLDFAMCLDGVATKYDRRDPVTYMRFNINLPRRGWTFLELDMASIYGGGGKGEGFSLKCGNLGIVLHKRELQLLHTYVIDVIAHYIKNFDISKICSQMGWTADYTFIYGLKELKGTSIMPENVTPEGTSINVLARALTKKGELDKWLKQIQLLSQAGCENHAFGYLVGFAAPLYKFTILGGVTINFYSEYSGVGKTTACNSALSIYGDPNLLVGGPKDTIVALYAKTAALNNIPLLIDEISEAKGFEVSDLLYTISSGKEKSKGDKNSELRESKHWNTILLTTSNKSMYDKLDEHTSSSAGQKARLLEVEIPKAELLPKEVTKEINIAFAANHGHAAEIYLNRLVDMYDGEELVEQVQGSIEKFSAHFLFDFLGEERFVGGIFACAWLGAKIAMDLGLCPNFDLDRIFKSVLQTVAKNRIQIQNAVEPAEDVLNSFLASSNQNLVKIILDDEAPESSIGTYRRMETSAPAGAILGRVSVRYKDRKRSNIPYYGQVSIDVNAFKQYCRKFNKPVYKYLHEFTNFRNYIKHNINITDGVISAVDSSPALPLRLSVISFDLPMQLLEHMRSDLPVRGPLVMKVTKDVIDNTDFEYGANVDGGNNTGTTYYR